MGITTNQPVHNDMAMSTGFEMDELWLARQIRVALAHLEQALCSPPVQRAIETGHAIRVLLTAEEMLAAWEPKDHAATASRLPLLRQQLDGALHLLEGLEIPRTGKIRKALAQARDILHAILVAGLL